MHQVMLSSDLYHNWLVFANFIMTELESTIVKELVEKSYVDDTLLLVKDKDINHVHKRLNSFNRNIKFTVGTFLECTFLRY